jgi:hypothetical protein
MSVGVDFAVQFASTVAGGLFVAFVQPAWVPNPEPRRPQSRRRADRSTTGINVGGNQVIVGGGATVSRPISQTVVNNQIRQESSAPGGTTDGWGIIVGGFVAVVVAAALFLEIRGVLWWFCLGVALGLVTITAAAIVRSLRAFGRLPGSSGRVLVQVGVSVCALAVAWIGVRFASREGFTVDGVGNRLPEFVDVESAGLWHLL